MNGVEIADGDSAGRERERDGEGGTREREAEGAEM